MTKSSTFAASLTTQHLDTIASMHADMLAAVNAGTGSIEQLVALTAELTARTAPRTVKAWAF